MATFSVTSASYDGSSTDLNPLVFIQGTFNGLNVICNFFWDSIQQANNFGGAAAVQDLIAVGFQNCNRIPPFLPSPSVPASQSPPPNTGDAAYANSVCEQAMVGSWAA